MNNMLLAIAILLVVSGCKATIESEVNISDLLEAETKSINGDLYVEVSSCNDYEDSRKPSTSVIKAQETIPKIFDEAEYIECFSRKFKSLARFSIPIVLNKNEGAKLIKGSQVNIISNSRELLTIGLSNSIKESLERIKKESYGLNSFDLKVNIILINDTGKKYKFEVTSAYVEDKPYIYSRLTIGEGEYLITLSDVSVSSAIETGYAEVLYHSETK